jgi:hypothetical protein
MENFSPVEVGLNGICPRRILIISKAVMVFASGKSTADER